MTFVVVRLATGPTVSYALLYSDKSVQLDDTSDARSCPWPSDAAPIDGAVTFTANGPRESTFDVLNLSH